MNVFEVKDVNKSFDGFSMKNINIILPEGSIMGLVGENGAGKSTLINLLMNTLKRNSGEISVLGIDNQTAAFENLKNEIGIVPDEAYFPDVLTLRNVNLMMKNTFTNWDEKLYFEYINKFSIPPKKPFKNFSRGMKMKFAIAVALSHHPKFLILDEATSGLDPIIRDEILDIFNEFTREEGHSILLSSHILSDLEKICDYIAFMHNGEILFCKEKDSLLEEYAVVHMTKEEFKAVPSRVVKGKKETPYGVEALVLKQEIAPEFQTEYTSIEDIILFLVKGV